MPRPLTRRIRGGSTAAEIGFTPAGSIAATDVQAAIEEVASEAGGGGAPTDVDYLVGTASAGLSAEIAVGTSPGGELGGTWASPTVDASHSGSTHAATQSAAEATAAAALATHEADTTSIHGIADTSALETTSGAQTKVDTHVNDTADAHDASAISIADAGGDFTATDVEGALAELQSDNETHAAAADPHTGYVLESLIDAAGDLIIGSAADTPARLARGADDTFLRATGSTVAFEAIPFSVGALLEGSPPSNGTRMVWRAPFACTVTNVRGHIDAGTNAVVNARINQTSDFLASDLTVSTADSWADGGSVQNTAVAAGDDIEVELVSTSGAVTQVNIQVDLTRP